MTVTSKHMDLSRAAGIIDQIVRHADLTTAEVEALRTVQRRAGQADHLASLIDDELEQAKAEDESGLTDEDIWEKRGRVNALGCVRCWL